jgi:hypothetical protein
VCLNVSSRYAAALAAPRDLTDIDFVLPDQLAHHRGEELWFLLDRGRLGEELLDLLLGDFFSGLAGSETLVGSLRGLRGRMKLLGGFRGQDLVRLRS